jgi:WD40 repeat protein
VNSVQITPDNEYVATVDRSGDVIIWSGKGAFVNRIDELGDVVTFSHDGRSLLTAIRDEIQSINFQSGAATTVAAFSPKPRRNRSARMSNVSFSATGNRIVAWNDKRVTILGRGTPETTLDFVFPNETKIRRIGQADLHPLGERVAISDDEGRLEVWRIQSQSCNSFGKATVVESYSANRLEPRCNTWSQDGKQLLCHNRAFSPNGIRVIGPSRGDVVSISHDGVFLVVADRNAKSITLWEVLTGQPVCEMKLSTAPYIGFPTAFEVSRDFTRLVATNRNGSGFIWNVSCPHPTPPQLEKTWELLGSASSADAFRAISFLKLHGDDAVELIKRSIAIREPDNSTFTTLANQLGNPKFQQRQAAMSALRNYGVHAEAKLRSLLNGKTETRDVKRRIDQLLHECEMMLRERRCIHILECLNTRRSRQLLEFLAKNSTADRFRELSDVAVSRCIVK